MDRSYNIDLLGGSRVSDQAWQNSFYVAISVSAHAALRCVTACLEDFRADLAKISIPVLVIHGDQDRVLPYEAAGSRLPALLRIPAPSSSRAGRTRLSGPTPTRSQVPWNVPPPTVRTKELDCAERSVALLVANGRTAGVGRTG
jgi:pimeloyl-ACP methyl ester carboxylesterase